MDLDTYNTMRQRWKLQQQEIEAHTQEVRAQYGSLKDAPQSLGPFETINPVIGNKNALVLLTEFNDLKHIHEPAEFQETLFSKGKNSLRDYYLEASWNKLDINGKTSEQWFKVSGNVTDYVDDAVYIKYPRSRKLVKEILVQAINKGFNFKPFASNGKIDILLIVYAGYGLDKKHDVKKYIRPHRGKLKEPFEVQKGVYVENYALISERPLNIGTYCHELGHILGLPDLYNESIGPMIGSWCLMSSGNFLNDGKTPAHPSAWCKVYLGWKKPTVIQDLPHNIDIPAVIDDDGVIYKIEVPGNKEEYFLLENRQQKGFDRFLPDSGLLVWHVDETHCVHKAPNSDPANPGILLEQSDGNNELHADYSFYRNKEIPSDMKKDMMGDDGDAYPGKTMNRAFDENSNPSSNSVIGSKTGISITSISDSNDYMKAKAGIKKGYNTPPEKQKVKRQVNIPRQIIQNYMALQSSKTPKIAYDKGFEDAKTDLIEKLEDEEGLKVFKSGYELGYKDGKEIIRKKTKSRQYKYREVQNKDKKQ